MNMRRDAYQGLVQFSRHLDEICSEYGSENTRYTIGRVQLSPNYVGVVPRLAEFTLDLREVSSDLLTTLNQKSLEAAQSIADAVGLTFLFRSMVSMTQQNVMAD